MIGVVPDLERLDHLATVKMWTADIRDKFTEVLLAVAARGTNDVIITASGLEQIGVP